MTMITKILNTKAIGCALLCLSFVSPAQENNASIKTVELKQASEDSRAKLLNIMTNIHSFSADFRQLVFSSEGNTIQQAAGQLTVQKPNLVNWHTVMPEENQIISDGDTLWLYDPFIEQATAYSLAQSLTNTPILLLSTTDELIWQQFNIEETDPNSFVVRAKDEQSQVKSLSIKFSVVSNDYVIDEFVIDDATGQRSKFSLNSFLLNPSLDKKVFEFNQPENVYLDDQR